MMALSGFVTSRASAFAAIVISLSMVAVVMVPASSEAETQGESVLRMGFLQKIDSLNPNVGLTEVSYTLYGLVYDGLQSVDGDLNSVGNLALGCGIADEYEPYGSVWDYNLTRDARWHDGEALTADDVVFTLNLNCQHYETMWAYQPYAYYMQYAEKLDEYTVRVHFFDRDTSEPMSVAYGSSLFIPILPEHLLGDWSATYISFNWQGIFEGSDPPIVGTGPFMATEDIYEEWLGGDVLTLVRNPYYRNPQVVDETVKFDKIEMHFFDDATAMVIALEMGDLDVAKLPPPEYTVLKGKVESGTVHDIETFDGPRCDQYWTNILINFNNAGPNPSRLDPIIRQAMAIATNKNYINDNFYLGFGEPGSTLVSPVSENWHYEPTAGELFSYDKEAANALLEAGGYRYTIDSPSVRVATADSYAVQAGLVDEGTLLVYHMAVRQEYPEERQIAQYLQDEWAQIGIMIDYDVMTEAALGSLVYSYAYDTAIWYWSSDPDPNYILFCLSEAAISGWNDIMYDNPDYEQNYTASVQELDVGLRETYVDSCQRIFYLDVGYIILDYVYQTYAWRTDTFIGWGDWAAEPGRSIDASWGANPLYFDLAPYGYIPPEDTCLVITTADVTGVEGDNGWYVSDVTVELDTELIYEDYLAPYTSAIVTGVSGANGWYLSAVDIELSAVDDFSGVEATYYSLDGGGWNVYSNEFQVSTEGTHLLSFYSVDVAGNVEGERATPVKIDWSLPTITVDLPDGFVFESTPVMINLTCSDNVSGVSECMYSLDGGAYVPSSCESFLIYGLANGTYNLEVIVYDDAGNTADDSVWFTVNVMISVPHRSVDYYWYDMFNHPLEEWYDWRAWIYDEFILTEEYPYLYIWEGYPPGNLWIHTFMRLNTNAENLTEVNMVSNPEFLPLFSDTVRGGNAEIDLYMNYITEDEGWDKLGPAAMGYFDGWYVALNGTVTLDEQAAKAVLGMTTAEFDDFSNWWVDNSVSVTYAWEEWMIDEAGSSRLDIFWMYDYPLQFVFFELDAEKVGEEVVLTFDTISWGAEALMTRWLHEAFMPTEWYMEDLSFHADIGPETADITFDAAVAYSGFAYESIADGSPCWAWEAMLQDYVLSSEPPYENESLYDRYWDWDGFGMFEYYNRAPGSAWYGTMMPYDYTPGAWNLSENETLTFSWPEDEVLFFLNDPGNDTGLVPDTSELWSNMTVQYMEPMPSDFPANVVIDTEARIVTFTGPIDFWTWSKEQSTHGWLADEWDRIGVLPYGMPYVEFKATSPAPGESLTSDIRSFVCTISDPPDEADHTYYRIDGGEWTTYVAPFVISEDGEHVLDRYSVDSYGNVESVRTRDIKIDKTSPELTITTSSGAEFAADDVNISWTCADACSGIYSVEYSVDGGTLVDCTSHPWVVLPDLSPGDHEISITVRDRAGNEMTQTLSFTVKSGGGLSISDEALVLALAGIIVAVAVALSTIYLIRRKPKGDGPSGPT